MRADASIEELRDVLQITDLIHGYCRALDAMDLDALVSLFTEDCVVDYGPEPRLQSHGADALRRDLMRMWRWSRTSHHSSNVQVELAGADAATAISYVLAWHEAPDGSTATMMGQYHDELLRTTEGWRIARRRQVMTGNDSGFTVGINRFARLPDQRKS